MAARLLANLIDLSEGWEVRIETRTVGCECEWIVTVTDPGNSDRSHTYRDAQLERAVARAWAGEPT